jgi:hypothetical protein
VKLEFSYTLRFRISEKKELRRTGALNRQEVSGVRRKSDEEELSNMNSSTNTFYGIHY